MNINRIIILTGALILSGPGLASAGDEPNQDPALGKAAGADQPEVMEVLEKADDASKAVKAVSYDAEFYRTGHDAESVPRITGTAKLREARQSLLGRLTGQSKGSSCLRIEYEFKDPGSKKRRRVVVASNGKVVCQLDEDKRVLVQGELPGAWKLLGRKGMHPLYMREYIHPAPFHDELTGKIARHEGITKVGDIECHTIYIMYSNNSESRWYFGTEDYLPRRVDRIYSKGGFKWDLVLVVTNLNTEPELDDDDFFIECPEGFKVKHLEADKK